MSRTSGITGKTQSKIDIKLQNRPLGSAVGFVVCVLGVDMKKFRTVVSLIIMIIAGIAGLFIGAAMNEGLNGAILFSMIAGISCIIYMIDNKED